MIIIGRIVCACVTIWQVNVQHFQHVQSTIRPIKQEGPVKIWNGSKQMYIQKAPLKPTPQKPMNFCNWKNMTGKSL